MRKKKKKKAKLEALETSPNFNPRVGIEMPFVRVALLKDCLCNDFFIQERKKKRKKNTVGRL